jgi:surface glycoprotein (TIGR04207 family)
MFLALIIVASVIAAGVAFTGSAAADAPPDSTTDSPGTLQVSLLNESTGSVNATYGVNTTSGTINVTNGSVTDQQVADIDPATESAKAIQFAIDSATAENSTVRVGPGTYNSSDDVVIDAEGLTVEGPNAGIDGNSSERGTEAIINGRVSLSADGIVFDGFDVTRPNTTAIQDSEALLVSGTPADVVVRNNIVRDFDRGDTGFYDVEGIHVFGGDEDGVPIENVTITQNLVTGLQNTEGGGAAGISVQGAIDNATIEDNTATGIGQSVSDYAFGVVIRETENNDAAPTNVTVIGNNLTDVRPDPESDFDGVGVEVEADGTNYLITENEIRNNTLGLEIKQAPSETRVVRNNIVNNDRFGLDNLNDTAIDATENWWGSANGPNTSGNAYNDGDQGANVTGDVEFTPWLDASTDSGGESFAPVTNDSDGQFASIQAAVDAASTGDIITAADGIYQESVEVNKLGLTIRGEGSPVIDGRIDISVDGTTIEDLTVRDGEPSDPPNEVEAIFVGNANGFDDTNEDVVIRNVTVEDVHPHNSAKTVEGIHVKHYDAGENIDGVVISDVTIQNVTQRAAGANGVKLQAGIRNISINDSTTIEDIEGSWAYGVVTTPSSGESGVPENVDIERNTITNVTATTYSGVGVGIDGGNGNGFADPEEVTVFRNNLKNNDIAVLNKNQSGLIDARLNWWGSNRGPRGESTNGIVGAVGYDPFLTTPQESIEVDDVGDTQQFGQDLEVPGDQQITAVGFPGPTQQTVGEAFSDLPDDGSVVIYEFNRSDQTWDTADGVDQIQALDAFLIVRGDASPQRADDHVTFSYADTGEAPANPDAETLTPGFNFIAAPALGNAYDVLGAPSDGDALYGQYPQPEDQTALLFTEKAEEDFIELTFNDGDDPIVTPYTGYFIYKQEQRGVPVIIGAGTTADELTEDLERTDE